VRKRFAGRDLNSPEKYYRAFFSILGKSLFRSPQKARHWYFNRFMPRMIRVLNNHCKPRPGVMELLMRYESVSSGKPSGSMSKNIPRIAIYSDYPLLQERLEALGIITGPEIPLYGPESFGAQKPAARPFQSIARDLGAAPEETLVIGDREDTAGLGAFKAGMRFFCLKTGRKRRIHIDPYNRKEKDPPHGPSLIMYTGVWDDLYALFSRKYFN
jgi:FMN phosphatase YigB (HAD superfamily)